MHAKLCASNLSLKYQQTPGLRHLSSRVDVSVVKSVVRRAKLTHCNNDPLPLNEIVVSGILDTCIITELVNRNIEDNTFLETEKKAIIKLISNGKLDSEEE